MENDSKKKDMYRKIQLSLLIGIAVVFFITIILLLILILGRSKNEAQRDQLLENSREQSSLTEIQTESVTAAAETEAETEPETEPEDGAKYPIENIDGMTYIYGILIANKTYSLPADYDPGADQEALDAFDEMQADAAAEGLDIHISSGYRSYDLQKSLYERYCESDGKELADTYSSRPGHSDHQTGLAFDLNSIDDSFGYTPESDWVAENCYKYGFIIRFPEGKDEYTGYQYEPWHIRYVGVEKAEEIYKSGLSLEEFLGIDSKYED